MLRRRRGRRGITLARVALPGLLLAVAAVLLSRTEQLEAYARSPFPVVGPVRFSPALAERRAPRLAAERWPIDRVPVEMSLARGETLGSVFADLGLGPADTLAAVEQLREHLDLRKLQAGEEFSVELDPESRPTGFEFTVEDRGRLELKRAGSRWVSRFSPFRREVVTRSIHGRLEGSLIASVEAAGGAPLLAYQMADILQWDLDFNRDLRRGDRFEAVFQETFLDGERSAVGPILALTYENAGTLFEAYRFGASGGYYDGEGRPLQKMFLRSPLRFSRITSRFSSHRFHPILKAFRPHYGVDYGAPVGTPVRVTASGVVRFVGWDRGGGKTVKVRHPNGYLTAYLHLSRFARGMRSGKRVLQGAVIGYVGATGLATGPHLDYRVRHHGTWIDPLSLRRVPAEPIPASYRAEFATWRDRLRVSLASGEPPRLDPSVAAAAAPSLDGSRSSEDEGPAVAAAR